MTFSKFSTSLASAILVIFLPVLAMASHPAQGYAANDVKDIYAKGNCLGLDLDDLWFVAPNQQTPLSRLSEIEKYMIGGSTDSSLGTSLISWQEDVFNIAVAYYRKFGYLPDVLTAEEIGKLPQAALLKPEVMEIYRNPITGVWPKLKAKELSPGDIYMRPLSESEKQYFGSHVPVYQRIWYKGLSIDTDAIERGNPIEDSLTQKVQLEAPPFYIRIYGKETTLVTTIMTLVSLKS